MTRTGKWDAERTDIVERVRETAQLTEQLPTVATNLRAHEHADRFILAAYEHSLEPVVLNDLTDEGDHLLVGEVRDLFDASVHPCLRGVLTSGHRRNDGWGSLVDRPLVKSRCRA